jgi:hypothetical protein
LIHFLICRFTVSYSNNMTFATIKVGRACESDLLMSVFLDSAEGLLLTANIILDGNCRVEGIRRQSTSRRGVLPCTDAGYSIVHSDNPVIILKDVYSVLLYWSRI